MKSSKHRAADAKRFKDKLSRAKGRISSKVNKAGIPDSHGKDGQPAQAEDMARPAC